MTSHNSFTYLLVETTNNFINFERLFHNFFQDPSDESFQSLQLALLQLKTSLESLNQWNNSVLEEVFQDWSL